MRTRLCMRKLTDDPGNLLAPVFPAYRQTLIEGRYVPNIQGRYFACRFPFWRLASILWDRHAAGPA